MNMTGRENGLSPTKQKRSSLIVDEKMRVTIVPEDPDKTLSGMQRKSIDAAGLANNRKEISEKECHVPPDGGARAWLIMIGSFVINGVLFSVINTYSLIYLELQNRLIENGETEASSKAGELNNTIFITFYQF